MDVAGEDTCKNVEYALLQSLLIQHRGQQRHEAREDAEPGAHRRVSHQGVHLGLEVEQQLDVGVRQDGRQPVWGGIPPRTARLRCQQQLLDAVEWPKGLLRNQEDADEQGMQTVPDSAELWYGGRLDRASRVLPR